MIKLAKVVVLFGAGLLILAGCTSEGNGSGVGTGMVTGKLYEPDGETPAKGATVVVRNRNATAMVNGSGLSKTAGALYTTLTDASGNFSFDTIIEGEFVIEGSDDKGNMALYDSVDIDQSIDKLELPSDTLEPSGTITGTIELSQGGNFIQVFVLAFGVDRFSQVKSDGTFTFGGLAEGVYKIKVLSLDPGYLSFDTTGIVIESGGITDLGTIRLQSKVKLPVPQNLTVTYDTAQMIATLSWEATPEGITAGYNVYRIAIDQICEATDGITTWLDTPQVSLSNRLIKETVCMDTTLYLDYYNERISDHVQYVVTMVDTNGNESGKSTSGDIAVVNNWVAVDSYSLSRSIIDMEDIKLDRKNNLWILGRYGELECYSSNGERMVSATFNLSDQAPFQVFSLIPSCDEDGGIGVCNRTYQTDPMIAIYNYYYVSTVGDTTSLMEWKEDTTISFCPPAIFIVDRAHLYGRLTHGNISVFEVETGLKNKIYEFKDSNSIIRSMNMTSGNGIAIRVQNEITQVTSGNPPLIEDLLLMYDGTLPIASHKLSPLQISSPETKLLFATDSMVYFQSESHRLLPNGTVEKSKMPLCQYHNKGMVVRSDGIVVNITDFYSDVYTVTMYKKRTNNN